MTSGIIDVFPLPRGPLSDGTGKVGGWYISSYFGGRPNPFSGVPSWHGGMDLVGPGGTPMYAVKAGRIHQAWDPGGGGNWTRLVCDDGDVFGYGHAAYFAIERDGKVFATNGGSRRVEAGDLIAVVGTTGSSTGNHLHFAYQPAGWARYGDPFDLLANCHRYAGDPPRNDPRPPPVEPLHPEHTPEEIIVTHRYWDVDGQLFAAGVEPFLSPHAVGADGLPQSADHYVGGLYVYAFRNPAEFVAAVGTGTQAEKLNRANPVHAPIIAALEGAPRVFQAA